MSRVRQVAVSLVAGAGLFALGAMLGYSGRPPVVAPHAAGAGDTAAPVAASALARKDAPAARTLAEELAAGFAGDRTTKRRDLRARIVRLSVAEIPALLEQATQISISAETTWWVEALLARWTELDPRGALAWARARKHRREAGATPVQVIMAWAEHDPRAAAEVALNATGGFEKQGALGGVAQAWAATDPIAAAAWFDGLPAGANRDEAKKRLLEVWSRRDPAAALAWVKGAEASRWRDRVLGNAIGELARVDPTAALREFESLPAGAARDRASGRFAVALAESDPRLAGDFALTMPAGGPRNEAIAEVARTMGRQEPAAALAWLAGSVADEAARRGAMQQVLGDWAEKSPGEASRQLDLLSGSARENLAARIAGKWAQTDLDAAVAWTRGLPDEKARTQAATQCLVAVAYRDPARALALAANEFSTANPERTWGTVGSMLAAGDADRVTAWMERVPAGAAREAFLSSAIPQLGYRSPGRAIDALALLDAGERRREIAGRLVDGWVERYPDGGVAALATVRDPALRDLVAEEFGSRWLAQDEAAARRWLAQAALPEELKQRLLRPRPKP